MCLIMLQGCVDLKNEKQQTQGVDKFGPMLTDQGDVRWIRG